MAKVTQHLTKQIKVKKACNRVYLWQLCFAVVFLYTPGTLNTNIEQEDHNMPRIHTPREVEFLEYFRRIDKRPIMQILSEFRSSTGPDGYATSLVLARILKVKERISSDRELSDKLAKIGIYREAIGIGRQEIPAHNTFHTLRQRLGPEGFIKIHQRFVLEAYKVGLLAPPIPDLPKMVRDKIILVGDSTFLKAVASTKGEKDVNGKKRGQIYD